MKSNFYKAIGLIGFICLLTGNAWALPAQYDSVKLNIGTAGGYYQVAVNGGDVFQSFCLERNEYFNTRDTYTVESVIGSATGKHDPDPIDDRSKWLFAAYWSNKLGGATATDIQYAVWYLEDEWDYAGAWEKYDQDYDPHLAAGWDIRAVNIISKNAEGETVYNQSQLVGVAPVPEPATLLLFGTGLIGLAGLGHRKLKR